MTSLVRPGRAARPRRPSIHQLDARIGRMGLAYRHVACGDGDPAELAALEEALGAECRWHAQTLVSAGRGHQVRRLLRSRRKLASLVACRDVDLLWRYVAFIDALREAARIEADDDGD